MRLERVAECPAVAHEDTPALVRLVQPLVRVEGDRVRAAELAEGGAPALGQYGEAAVRRIDVKPQTVFTAQVCERRDRVDGTGARGAGVRDDAERPPAVAFVDGDRVGERRGA